jgi:curved DNA-binding protein CbpA
LHTKRYEHLKHYSNPAQLQRSFTLSDIREAFIHLSKESHPDTSKTITNNAEQFTEIIEAYRVLGKQELRSSYDMALQRGEAMRVNRDIIHEPWKIDPSQYTNKYQKPNEYYGINGVRKMSNWRIVIACMIFAGFGEQLN